ncbi:MAG TPA: orotate phosphoribosyltransferase [Acidimicrobiales bacterium]|nr:orotate phosphoribosyltransferase [Acidimicrobiales bacterium]
MERTELGREITRVAHLTGGEFTLRSGLVTDTYFDKFRFTTDPVLLREVAAGLAGLLPADTEVLAGLELGGVPLAAALALHTGLPATYVRKARKTYGTAKLAEGDEIGGKRVVIIEDVVTTGGQVVLSAADLRAEGAAVTAALCVIDRETGGAESLAEAGLELCSLFRISDLT